MMRLDLWLGKVCLLKTRSQAKNGCQSGKILLDGKAVKESYTLRGDEVLTIAFSHKEIRVKVLAIPAGNVAKKSASEYYEILEEIPIDPKSGLDL
ncbi:MAG: RNA-binding protein [bacterium]|nr:RNA-binding protein [bacterium]